MSFSTIETAGNVSPLIDPTMSETSEKKIMTVWPGIGSMSLGRWVGGLAGSRLGYGFFTLGKLLALVTIPLSLVVYLLRG